MPKETFLGYVPGIGAFQCLGIQQWKPTPEQQAEKARLMQNTLAPKPNLIQIGPLDI